MKVNHGSTSTSSSSSSSDVGQSTPVKPAGAPKVTNDKGNDNVVVDVSAMGNFADGVSNKSNAETNYAEMVAHLVVNYKNVAGVENPNVLVIDEDALNALLSSRGADSRESGIISKAAYAELDRRLNELEASESSDSASDTPAVAQSRLSQRLIELRSTLLAHKRAFAIVAGMAVGLVVAATTGAIFISRLGDGEARNYEFREFNYSRGMQLHSTTLNPGSYETREAYEISAQSMAEHAWNIPNEESFEPRKSLSGFDVFREFNTTGPKFNGTTTLARFNLTDPSPLAEAFRRSEAGLIGFGFAELGLAFVCALIVYRLIMSNFK